MIDTHCHLYLDQFKKDQESLIREVTENLDGLINIGIDAPTSQQGIELLHHSPKFYVAIGFHPEDAINHTQPVNTISTTLRNIYTTTPEDLRSRIVAIGEIGLDYFHEKDPEKRQVQQQTFSQQIEFANEMNLPIIIHSRDAFEDTITIIRKYIHQFPLKGVWHSFTGTNSQANQITELGFYLGINGILTYPSASELREAVKHIEQNRLLLETDAPFLSPQPLRKERNTPINVTYVAGEIAMLRNESIATIESITDQNAKALFNIDTL